jgi:putative Holliday junction resolvase
VDQAHRILALDVGLRRIGLALADERGAIVPLDALNRKTMAEDVKALTRIAAERRITLFLVGLPLNMNGSEGHMVEFVRNFAERLRDAGLSLQRMLALKRRGGVDRLAAVILLEDYLRIHPVTE